MRKIKIAFLITMTIWICCVIFSGAAICFSKPSYVQQLEKMNAPYNGESHIIYIPWFYPLISVYSLDNTEPSDEILQNTVNAALDQYAEYTVVSSRNDARLVDNVLVDYIVSDVSGKVIAVRNDIAVDLGASLYSEAFTESILGMSPGETTNYSFTSADFEGKNSEYTVELTLLSIRKKTIPELTDDFAQKELGVDSAEKFNQLLQKSVKENLLTASRKNAYEQIIGKIMTDAEYVINSTEISQSAFDMFQESSAAAISMGMSLDDYLIRFADSPYYSGMGENIYFRRKAQNNVETRIVTEYLAERWNIAVSEEEISAKTTFGYSREEAEYLLIEDAVREKALKLARRKR